MTNATISRPCAGSFPISRFALVLLGTSWICLLYLYRLLDLNTHYDH